MDQGQRAVLRERILAGQSPIKPAGHFQMMRLSFEQICRGERPWTALGNFMNDWYAYHVDEREQLIADPLPDQYPQEYHQWAAFCAASVRWFCSTYEVPCPAWVDDPQYVLITPWYLDHAKSEWAQLRASTPEEFSRQNIFTGNTLYTNKYERDSRGFPLKEHPVDLQIRRTVVREAATRLRQRVFDNLNVDHLDSHRVTR